MYEYGHCIYARFQSPGGAFKQSIEHCYRLRMNADLHSMREARKRPALREMCFDATISGPKRHGLEAPFTRRVIRECSISHAYRTCVAGKNLRKF